MMTKEYTSHRWVWMRRVVVHFHVEEKQMEQWPLVSIISLGIHSEVSIEKTEKMPHWCLATVGRIWHVHFFSKLLKKSVF